MSRYSQNSKYSRSKSRISRSKSSGKSGEKQPKSKSISNERKQKAQESYSRKQGQKKSHNKNIHDLPILATQMLHSQSQLEGHHLEQLERAQSSFEMNHILNDVHNSQIVPDKKRKTRGGSVLRNRPKSSMLPEYKKDSIANIKGQKKKQAKKHAQQAHNSSIENLQRQVLENQKILLNNMAAQRSQKQSKRQPNHSGAGQGGGAPLPQ